MNEDATEQSDGQAAPNPSSEQQAAPTSEQQGQQDEPNTAQGAPSKTNPENRKTTASGGLPQFVQEQHKVVSDLLEIAKLITSGKEYNREKIAKDLGVDSTIVDSFNIMTENLVSHKLQ
ncbi:hypothetical protein SESBI_44873 [Sesbania bispinosa]|nr:hypothetical protein SESBI_44873 [Sesbania bispinosa]